MTLTEKKQHKAKAKIFLIIAYLTIPFAFMFYIGINVMYHYKIVQPSPLTFVLLVCGFILPLIIGTILTILGQKHRNALRLYKDNIITYRQNRFFIQCISALHTQDFDTATDIYNNLIKRNVERTFISGMFMGIELFSNDEKIKLKGLEKLNTIKELYNTINVYLINKEQVK
jgi:hypothetical protein